MNPTTPTTFQVPLDTTIPDSAVTSNATPSQVTARRNNLGIQRDFLSNVQNTLSSIGSYLSNQNSAGDLFSNPQQFLLGQMNAAPSQAALQYQDLLNSIANTTSRFGRNREDMVNDAYANAGVNDANARLTGIQQQTADRQVRQRQDVRALSTDPANRGMARAFQNDRENRINADANAELADLALQEIAATGSYNRSLEVARTQLEEQVTAYNDQIAMYQANLDALTPVLDDEQKKYAEQQKIALSQLQQQITQQASDKLTIREIAMEALMNGADQATANNILTSESPEDAVSLAGSWLGRLDRLQAMYDINKPYSTSASSLNPFDMGGAIVHSEADTQYFNQIARMTRALYPGLKKGDQIYGDIQSYVSTGNYAAAYNQIATAVGEGLTDTNKLRFSSARTDSQLLLGLRDSIAEYQAAGGNMNIFTGTLDTIQNRLGVLVTDPKYAALATQLNRNFYEFRNQMTGAAFGPGESADYERVVPRAGATFDLNLAVLDGAINAANNRVVSTVESMVPGASRLLDFTTQQDAADSQDGSTLSDEEAYQEYLKSSQ